MGLLVKLDKHDEWKWRLLPLSEIRHCGRERAFQEANKSRETGRQ